MSDLKLDYIQRLMTNVPKEFTEGLAGSGLETAVGPMAMESTMRVLESLETGNPLNATDQNVLEAIIIPHLRPVLNVTADSFDDPPAPWEVLTAHRANVERAIRGVGRVEVSGLPGVPYGGTGFLIGPNLIMTNRHVAELFTPAVGLKELVFRPGRAAELDLKQEIGSNEKMRLKVRRVRMVHPFWDAAFLEVDGVPAGHAPLTLAGTEPEKAEQMMVLVIGYPAMDSRNDLGLQLQMFQIFNKKRLLPGNTMGYRKVESFGSIVEALAHDCSTLGGNSGSAVVDPATGNVVGLHFAGVYLQANYAVPTWQLALDSKVVDLGVQFTARTAVGTAAPVWLKKWDTIETTPMGVGVAPAAGVGAAPAATGRKIVDSPATDWIERAKPEDIVRALQENREATVDYLRETLGEVEADGLIQQLTPPMQEGLFELFDPDPDPNLPEIVYLHGIMGGHLARPGFLRDRMWLDLLDIAAGNMARALTLKDDGFTPGDNKRPLEPDGMVNLFYGNAERAWRKNRYVVHSFSYDWRRSISSLADHLHNFIESKRQTNPQKQFMIVAHSMGGLVSSLYAVKHPEWREAVQRAVYLGTPLGGSYAPLEAFTGTYDLLRKLSMVSVHNDLDDMRRMAVSLPGLIDMLPNPALFPDAAAAYSSTVWPDGMNPLQKWLDQSRNLKATILSSPILERTTLLVSFRFATVSACEVVNGAIRRVPANGAGDGTVPAKAAAIAGIPAFKVNKDHGNIPKDPLAIQAVIDLGKTGNCSLDAVQPEDLTAAPPMQEAPDLFSELAVAGIQERVSQGELRLKDVEWIFAPGMGNLPGK